MKRTFAYQAIRRTRGFGLSEQFGVVRLGAKLLVATFLLTFPDLAQAKAPLRDVKEIDNELYYIAIANEISEICPTITGRRLKAIGVMWNLRSKANELGYSDKEIREYVESDAEKARMRAKGEAYLAQNGASYENPKSFCTLGKKEIDRNSAIGVYLRAN